ncbi:MAG: response regulator transcription factor [Bacteroidetes bacterium]|nr:response regulator transcription factor [Bacteroidota bacterium]MCB0843638.1 response regulator transcription factor [Bacteroidota bacterium]
MKIRCVIVDDEPLALDVLEAYIDKIEDLELLARVDNAIEAFNLLNREKVDLLFLDIQMPKLTGIDLLKNISHPPNVIFTTAYRDYALEGYELNVVDYLLKPISFDRFLRAINKVYQINTPVPVIPQIKPQPSEPAAPATGYSDAFIYLKADKKMVKILLKEILYIESLKDYIRVKTISKSVTAYQRISYMEEKLPEDKFLRVHRSYIVSIDKVDAYSNPAVEIGDFEIPIGRNYRSAVLKALNHKNLLRE